MLFFGAAEGAVGLAGAAGALLTTNLIMRIPRRSQRDLRLPEQRYSAERKS